MDLGVCLGVNNKRKCVVEPPLMFTHIYRHTNHTASHRYANAIPKHLGCMRLSRAALN
jgi:hypothetical protein